MGNEEWLNFAKKILEDINEGVMVADENGLILSVNPAFQIVTGYQEDEVIGKNPNILQSGIHNKDFYRKLWEKVHEEGVWKGEIWNKRKNGEVFPEWLTLSSIKNEEGEVTNYIGVFTDISFQKEAERELQKLAHSDRLTGLANRYAYKKRMDALLATSGAYDQRLAILFLDLDRFQQINDSYGHEAGDRLLSEVALRLKKLLKNKDLLARIGGDEFAITLANINHPREAFTLAGRIIEVLSVPFWIQQQETYMSTSIGISFFPEDGANFDELLRSADKAMYKAKQQGRNRFTVYHNELDTNDVKTITMERELRKAIQRQELYLMYQPQINVKSGEISGAEALLRWKSRVFGEVSPGDFIPLAEEIGLIVPIGEWIMSQVCHDFKQVEMAGFSDFSFAVNISPLQFLQETFIDRLMYIIEKENVPPKSIELELTESTIMPNAKESIRKLNDLKSRGFQISIDDFGTGYSSLSYLTRFPLNRLKIDRSFIQGITNSQEDLSVVRAILTMAHSLELGAVAEGVESSEQLLILKEEQCDFVQGYYYSKPLRLEALIDLLYIWENRQEN
ncbi:putative bifunctional diguanylate cyclase/phosphodiesterase [Bacillus xiapuensis]|uniref:putative bifunctional diguanylate cyclase/phosphodiesterase n=1 Tax=Bacillus xiapuensis TaxID=2014075 RepID=UPI000C242AC7|nr:EAL domain-containing protein [Bacillus xiapuensis]